LQQQQQQEEEDQGERRRVCRLHSKLLRLLQSLAAALAVQQV
jgi:hypothetical protein